MIYIGCIKEVTRKNYATYEIKEYDFAILEWKCKMFIAKHISPDVLICEGGEAGYTEIQGYDYCC